MKFDFIIGNPPYQDETENKGDRANPLYDKFMDSAYSLSEIVMLIHPARFLFNAGQTAKSWNDKMLKDEHFKVIEYEPIANKIFPNTDIKGGVVISIRNLNITYGAIRKFIPQQELKNIVKKVSIVTDTYLDSIIASRGMYRFSEKFYADYPQALEMVGSGTGNMVVSNIFEKMGEVFHNTPCSEASSQIAITGRIKNRRERRYIKSEYILPNEFLNKYNVMVAKSSGTGRFGEVFGVPFILAPREGATDTYISIGFLETENEAEALSKYLKTKFFRAMLGVNKVTQDNPKQVWSSIPLQNFTPDSDIDWTASIPDIDKQLYAKYGLDETEIEFIETHVKEMQ